MYCGKCGAFNNDNDKFCGSCGAELRSDDYSKSKPKKIIKDESEPKIKKRKNELEEQDSPAQFKKHNVILICLTIVIIAGSLTAAGVVWMNTGSRLANKQLSLGEKYLSELKYDEAIAAFNKTIEIEPKNAKAYIGLADVYIQLKNMEKAEETLTKAIAAIPGEANLYIKLADIYISENKIEEAVKILENGYNATKSEAIKTKISQLNQSASNTENQTSVNNTDKINVVPNENYNGDKVTFSLSGKSENGDIIWTKEWKDLMATELSPASEFTLYNNKVFIVVNSNLYSLDLNTGSVLWQVNGTGACTHKPVIDDSSDTIYVTGWDGPYLLSAIDMDGKVKWHIKSESFHIYHPNDVTLSNNTIIVTAEGYKCIIYKDGTLEEVRPLKSSSKYVLVSSTLSDTADKYNCGNIFDNNKTTAWVEGASGDGIGEFAKFEFSSEKAVSSLDIINGYAKSQTLYYANNRVKKLKIEFSDGKAEEYILQDNCLDYQKIKFKEQHKTIYVKIIISDVYRGSKFSDTCISEVELN